MHQKIQALEGRKAPLISDTLNRLVNHMTDIQQQIFKDTGYSGLERWLEDDRERKLPEVLRNRPKVKSYNCTFKIILLCIFSNTSYNFSQHCFQQYYYYYEWTRERIQRHCGHLPEPVMDKMLTLEAGDLEVLLKLPIAVKAQVS